MAGFCETITSSASAKARDEARAELGNIVRIFQLNTVLGGLEKEFGNFKNSSSILISRCITYIKFLLFNMVPLKIIVEPICHFHFSIGINRSQ